MGDISPCACKEGRGPLEGASKAGSSEARAARSTPHRPRPSPSRNKKNRQKEEEGVPDLGSLKQIMASNWIETKRERKRVANYNEAELYKQVGGGGKGGGASPGDGWG